MNKNYFMVNRSKKCQFFLFIVLTNLITSCNKHFVKFPLPPFVSNKSIPSILNVPPVYVLKDSLLTIQSISTLDRRFNKGDGGLNRIQFMKVDNRDRDSTYKRTVRNLLKLNNEFKIDLAVSKNDSLYKELMTDTFLQNFTHLDMQRITFNSNIKNGLYLIITNLIYEAEGGLGIGGNLQGAGYNGANILYEFFNVKNGSTIQYTGFSLVRGYTFSHTRGGPKLKELLWVLKNLYKQSEKYYGKTKID